MSNIPYPSESQARIDIIEAGRRLYLRGLICGSEGNLSARISEDEIIITPSGVSKGFMNEDMLVRLDMSGKVLSGSGTASSETKMHLAIYEKSPNILSVCHAHPPIATTFAAAGVPLDKAYIQETVMLLGVIPIAKYAAPGSQELARSASDYCQDYHGVLLEQHGALTWGTSVMEALYRMENVEYTAKITMYSTILGFERTLDGDKIKELIALRKNWGISASLGEFI
ncbi:MAG: class II aldolase/adducin family protein [Oscillospiraceae bacterium]|nr:class II aldolase/adducin family protein [Oscillospiraceae bacterium]